METIYENDYYLIIADKSINFMQTNFKPASEFRTSEQMKADINNSVKFIEQYKPEIFLNNNYENKYPYKVDEQKWVADSLGGAFIKVGLKKLALIYPEELIAELALQQAIEEAGEVPFIVQYFTTEKEAIEWLKK